MASASSLLLAVLCSTFFVACLAIPTARILDGSEATANAFPSIVSVRRDNAHVCGGSVIAVNYILTAAHCVSELGNTPVAVRRVTIRVGSTNQYAGGKIVTLQKIFVHSGYGSFLNDVALLKTSNDLEIGPRVQIIPLAESEDDISVNATVTVAGWGRTVTGGDYAYKLQFSNATAVSIDECEESIGYGYASTLCLQNNSGKGSCNGDAGGPAICDNKLVGVSNFVIGSCGTKYPDVFARVPHFITWINETVTAENEVSL